MIEELGHKNILYINKYILFLGKCHVQIREYIVVRFNISVNVLQPVIFSAGFGLCLHKTVSREWQEKASSKQLG